MLKTTLFIEFKCLIEIHKWLIFQEIISLNVHWNINNQYFSLLDSSLVPLLYPSQKAARLPFTLDFHFRYMDRSSFNFRFLSRTCHKWFVKKGVFVISNMVGVRVVAVSWNDHSNVNRWDVNDKREDRIWNVKEALCGRNIFHYGHF